MRKVKIIGMSSTYMLLDGEVLEKQKVNLDGFKLRLEFTDGYWLATYRPLDLTGYGRTKEEAISSFGTVLSEALIYKLEQ